MLASVFFTLAMQTTSSQVSALEPAAYYDHYLKQGVRPNGRTREQHRPVSFCFMPSTVKNVVGSSLFLLGQTRVLSSATVQVGTPDLAKPCDGDLGENFSPLFQPLKMRET